MLIAVFGGCTKNDAPLVSSTPADTTPQTTTTPNDDENDPEPEPNDEGVISWITYGLDKVNSADTPPSKSKMEDTVTLYMGKGESESATMAVFSEKKLSSVSLVVKNAPPDVGITLYKQYYQTINNKKYPDGIALLNETTLIMKQTVQGYLITLTTTPETEASDKSMTIELQDKDGNVLTSCNLNLHVWDITYPENSYRTATDIEEDVLSKLSGLQVGSDEFRELYRHYYEKLLSYRMCAYDLPYDILDERADKYMSDPRVTAFQIPTAVDDDTLKKYYDKVSSNADWLKKAYAYPFDEPTNAEMYDEVITLVERIETICPELRVVVPFFKNFDYDGERDAIDVQAQYMEIFCVNTEPMVNTDFSRRLREELKADPDKELWTYVCWGPRYPFLNLFVNESGLDHRMLFWQKYNLDSDGFLYWSSTYWHAVGNPWQSMMTVPGLSTSVFGDGSLMYSGIGYEKACGSIRLDIIRDGIEDVELMMMAEEIFGRDWVLERSKKVSSDLRNYLSSKEKFFTIRNEIAEALEEALSDK